MSAIIVVLLVCAALPNPARAEDDPLKDCKWALVVGVGNPRPGDNEIESLKPGETRSTQEEIAQESGNKIIGHLVNDWGFQVQNNGQVMLNPTKKELKGAFEGLQLRVTGHYKCPEFYIKIHMQGHGTGNKGLKSTPPKDSWAAAPDDEYHVGFDLAGGDVLYDFELDKTIEDLAKFVDDHFKGKNSNVIVEVDSCFSQGMFDDYLPNVSVTGTTPAKKTLPSNVTIAWSNRRFCKVDGDSRHRTDWTRGFDSAFRDASGQPINATVEEAHKCAAAFSSRPAIVVTEHFTVNVDGKEKDDSKDTAYFWNGTTYQSEHGDVLPAGKTVTAANGIDYTWDGSKWTSAGKNDPPFPGQDAGGYLPQNQNPPLKFTAPKDESDGGGGSGSSDGNGSRDPKFREEDDEDSCYMSVPQPAGVDDETAEAIPASDDQLASNNEAEEPEQQFVSPNAEPFGGARTAEASHGSNRVQFEAEATGGIGLLGDTHTPIWGAHFATDIPIGSTPLFLAVGAGYENYSSVVTASEGSMYAGPTGSTFASTKVGIHGGVIDVAIGMHAAGFEIQAGPLMVISSLTETTIEGFCEGASYSNPSSGCETFSKTSDHRMLVRPAFEAEVGHRLFSIRGEEVDATFRYLYAPFGAPGVDSTSIPEGGLRFVFGGAHHKGAEFTARR